MHTLKSLSNPVDRITVKSQLAHNDKVKQAKHLLTLLQIIIAVLGSILLMVTGVTHLKEFNVVPFFGLLGLLSYIQNMKGEL